MSRISHLTHRCWMFLAVLSFLFVSGAWAQEAEPVIKLQAGDDGRKDDKHPEAPKPQASAPTAPSPDVQDNRDKAKRLMGLAEASQDAYADGLGSLMAELEAESAGRVMENPKPLDTPEPLVESAAVVSEENREELKAVPEDRAKPEAAKPVPAAVVPVKSSGLGWAFPKLTDSAAREVTENDEWTEKAEDAVREYSRNISRRIDKMEEQYGFENSAKTVRMALRNSGVRDDRVYDGAEQWAVLLSRVWNEVKSQILYQPALSELILTGHALKNHPDLIESDLPHLQNWMAIWEQTEANLQKQFEEAVEDATLIASLYDQSLQMRDAYAKQKESPERMRDEDWIKDGSWGVFDTQRKVIEEGLEKRLEVMMETARGGPSFEICIMNPRQALDMNREEDRRYQLGRALRKAEKADEEAIQAGQGALGVAEKTVGFRKNYEKAIREKEQAYRYYVRRREMDAWDVAEEKQAYQAAAEEAAKATTRYQAQLQKEVDVEKEVNRLRLEAKKAWTEYRRLCG